MFTTIPLTCVISYRFLLTLTTLH